MPRYTLPSCDPTDEQHWLRALARQGWVDEIRSDGRANLLRVAELVALFAGWVTLESRPTWAVLMARAGVSERTVARWLQELRVRGWLAHLERGSTPATRPMVLAHLEGNRAAVYGLRIPLSPEEALRAAGERLVSELAERLAEAAEDRPERVQEGPETSAGTGARAEARTALVDQSGSPSWPFDLDQRAYRGGLSRVSGHVDNSEPRPPATLGGKDQKDALRARHEWEVWATRVPTSRAQMLVAATWLCRELPIFGRLSRKLVRHLCRPYWQAGWCNRDVVHAMDFRPSVFGQQAGMLISLPVDKIASPKLWIQSRLGAWRTADGAILAGYRGRRVAEQAAVRQVREDHGRAGRRLLREGDLELTVERIADHGRRAAAEVATERGVGRPGVGRAGRAKAHRPTSAEASRAAARAELDAALEHRRAERAELMGRLADPLEAARAELAARTAPEPAVAMDAALLAEWDALTPEERHERALAVARYGRRAARDQGGEVGCSPEEARRSRARRIARRRRER